MSEVKGLEGIELSQKFIARIVNMTLAPHAIPGDATFTGEVSGKTFWYVRTDQLLKSKHVFAKEQSGISDPLPTKRMLREKSAKGANYKYKQRLCRNKGCQKVLKRDQRIVCSTKCEIVLKYTCLTMLANLGITVEEYSHFLEHGT